MEQIVLKRLFCWSSTSIFISEDHPEGALDDATIEAFKSGVINDRLAFLDEFTKGFFAAGNRTDLVSEPFRLYNWDIAPVHHLKEHLIVLPPLVRLILEKTWRSLIYLLLLFTVILMQLYHMNIVGN